MVPWTSKGEFLMRFPRENLNGSSVRWGFSKYETQKPTAGTAGKLGILRFENLLTDGFFRMGLPKPLGLPGLACGFFVSGKTAFNRQLKS